MIKIIKKMAIIGFTVLLLLIPISYFLRLKYETVEFPLAQNNFNKMDVAFIGGSHANAGFLPKYLWNNFKITSYNFSTGGQPIYLTYYYLKELLKKYDFQILVLDVYYLGLNDQYFVQEDYVRRVVDNMSWSMNKVDFINNCVPFDQRLSYYFNIIKYHSRWNKLTNMDFLPYSSQKNYGMLGGEVKTEKYGNDFIEMKSTDETVEIPENSLFYLNKIMNLLKKNDVDVILTTLPHEYNFGKPDENWVNDEEKMYNTVWKYANDKGITFLEFNNLIEEIGINPSEDMYNSTHLNLIGAEKVTKYIGEVIKKEKCSELRNNDIDTTYWELNSK